jgi:two-component system, chemotaxis family, protein-glutamate methylesterase/glutaminase
MSGYDVVVIGASWGGMRALEKVLAGLPGDFPTPIAVAQHRDVDAEDDLLPTLLARHTELEVADADDKDPLVPGRVLLAPPGYHLLIEDGSVALSLDAPVQFARPSIDELFESAASEYGERTIGVVLTGANADGAAGLAAIKRRGGYTMVQDPSTAERREMPEAALAIGPDAVIDLEGLPSVLCVMCEAKGVA